MSVIILSDSSCDISQEEARELDVRILPLKTLIDGVEYLDGVTLTAPEFYERLESCEALPTTSQLAPAEFEEAFRRARDDGDEVIAITLSGKLSGTAHSAILAASEFPEGVWVVDSGTVTIGQGILVRHAVELRRQGLSAEQIVEELERIKSRVCLLARVDTLEFLVRGGRLSKTAGFAGTILNVKPVISIDDGEVKVIGKARGSRQSNNMLTSFIKERGGADYDLPIMLAYSGNDDALLKGYVENSHQLWEGRLKELPSTMVGSTIGTHIGPGAIAVAFFAKE